jgi:hypothetical protein
MMRTLVLGLALLVQNNAASGTIAGRVFGTDGKPAGNIRVAIQPETRPDGVKQGRVLTQTDSSGTYRLTGLTPGRYYVMIGAVTNPLYYPGTASREEARLVSVSAGAVETVDVRIPAQESFQVRGRIVPIPPLGAVLFISPSVAPASEIPLAADGSFFLSGLSARRYSLRIRRQPLELLRGLGDFSFESGMKDLVIVSGRLTIKVDDGNLVLITAAAALAVEASRTVPDRPAPSVLRFPVQRDGAFTLLLPAGDHTIRLVNLPPEYETESIVSGTTNLLAEPLKTASPETLQEISISLRKAAPR